LSYIEEREKRLLVERHPEMFKGIEEVPTEIVRTPLQRVIQLLKRHRDMRFLGHKWEDEKPISMIITTLAAQAYDNESELYTALKNILDRISDYVNTHLIQKRNGEWYIPNPVDPAENFADRWNVPGSKGANAFFQWVEWVKQDLAVALGHDSLAEIEKALVPCFGKRAIAEGLNKHRRVNPASKVAGNITLVGKLLPSRFDVPHREKAEDRWPISLRCYVKITARYNRNGKWYLFQNGDRPLPKGCDLLFHADTNASAKFDVFWQVVNTGDEAQLNGDLRGQIFPAKTAGRGGLTQKERTAYTGTHWIECFIVKDGVCIARSGEFVVNIG